jgi:lipoprotein-releasing system permease protein
LNLNYFISKRISRVDKKSFSYTVTRIATIVTAFGILVMVVSMGILEGFKSRIRQKIFSFGAHIQVSKYDLKKSYEESPLQRYTRLYNHPDSVPGIVHIQLYSNKPGLLRTEEDIRGVILKGVWKDFKTDEFGKNIVEGKFITFPDSGYSKDILISRKISDRMNLKVGDPFIMIFSRTVSNVPTYRKLQVGGIYETGLEEFDEHFVLGDIRLNQKINNWDDSLVGGYEIFVNDFSKIDTIAEKVYNYMDYDMQIEKITDKYIQIFDWLKLLDRNVGVFLILILFVACFNMVATLLIMIMERTNMIGVLKALGATNMQIQQIFIWNGAFIILRGMLWGNVIGLGFCVLQYFTHVIPLDPENYYMDFVPIKFNWLYILFVNILTFTIATTVLLIPALFISRLKPVKAIKFN